VVGAVLGGILLVWLSLIVALAVVARRRGSGIALFETLRLGPDVVRLVSRLVRDPMVSRGVRVWLAALLVYLLSPIDSVPDFIPVIGVADDVIMVAIVLRFAVRRAGMGAIARHWPGTPQGLVALDALLGLRGGDPLSRFGNAVQRSASQRRRSSSSPEVTPETPVYVAYWGSPVRSKIWRERPPGVVSLLTGRSPAGAPPSGKRRRPWPTMTGATTRRNSSTNPAPSKD